jgi:hypothetical protein
VPLTMKDDQSQVLALSSASDDLSYTETSAKASRTEVPTGASSATVSLESSITDVTTRTRVHKVSGPSAAALWKFPAMPVPHDEDPHHDASDDLSYTETSAKASRNEVPARASSATVSLKSSITDVTTRTRVHKVSGSLAAAVWKFTAIPVPHNEDPHHDGLPLDAGLIPAWQPSRRTLPP